MIRPAHHRLLAALAALALGGCNEGPRIEGLPQTIAFGPAPRPAVNESTATVTATASSGLPVLYGSRTPDVCSVGAGTGLVRGRVSGRCTIAASQAGNTRYAAAFPVTQEVLFTFQGVIEFGPAPSLRVYDLGTVTAVETTGQSVAYAGTTPSSCSVEGATGLVAAIAPGDCTVVASAGDLHATQTFVIAPAAAPTVPGAPSGVSATAGDTQGMVKVRFGALEAGGSPITGYVVSSVPVGASGTGGSLPVTATCPNSCTGYRFVVAATNSVGKGPSSGPGDIVTRYAVLATFREPDTQPNDSVFVGTYTFNASAGTVSALRGKLSESMTGGSTPYPDDTMTWLTLDHQLSAQPVTLDGADGWLVTTFRLDVTDTFTRDPKMGGTDGWAPGSGNALHFGYPGANPGNAYAMIFVNAAAPTAAPTQGQINRMAYADCTPGGMMGGTCMTGTSEQGYGTFGSMGGHPVSQVTTRQ